MTANLPASVRARLLNIAKREGADFNQVLVRFALERLLYRLSRSRHAERFLLKGALLFTLWYDMPHRPTRDADLLGFGASDLDSLRDVFGEIAAIDTDDGIVFDPATVSAQEIRKEAGYAGARVLIGAELAKARVRTQVDVGFGDVVTPGPIEATYPVLIDDFPAPRLKTYPVYTVIAEKLHAIALLGMTNSRVKDYLDLQVLLEREPIDQRILAEAIAATFTRRGMEVPSVPPAGLTDEFAQEASRQALWRAFITKNGLEALSLEATVSFLRIKLLPALSEARSMASDRAQSSNIG